MNKDTNKLIPELRFPEFKNKGGWKIDSLGNLVEIKGRIGYRGYTRADIVEEGKGAITLSPSNFEENGSLNFEKCTYITWDKYEESPEIKLEEGQTVLVKTASVGKSAYVENLPEKATINPQIVILKPQKIERKYLAYSIFHSYVQTQIRSAVGAGAIPNMSQDSISKFDILLPPDKKGIEQQKIASCLSSLDELITVHSDKLEALNDHKKGLMQNLFPQEGEKVPKYRFPEFKNDGEWVEMKLGKIAENLDSKRVPITSNIREKGDIPYYGASGIIDYVKDYIFDEELLLISEDGANLIARVYPIAFSISGKTWVNNHAHVLKFEKWFTQVLVEKYLNSKNIEDFLTGMAQPKLNRGKLDIIPIPLPNNPKEQQKIASCLSSLDELITAQAEKIEQLQLHKKGLLQGLFPKIDN